MKSFKCSACNKKRSDDWMYETGLIEEYKAICQQCRDDKAQKLIAYVKVEYIKKFPDRAKQ